MAHDVAAIMWDRLQSEKCRGKKGNFQLLLNGTQKTRQLDCGCSSSLIRHRFLKFGH